MMNMGASRKAAATGKGSAPIRFWRASVHYETILGLPVEA